MSNALIALVIAIYKKISTSTKEIALLSIPWKTNLAPRLERKLIKELSPLIDEMFKQGVVVSNQIVKQEVARLGSRYLPTKYNKDLINTFNTDKSIFTGFYDKKYKDVFKKSEIDRLKRTILSGKYSGISEAEMVEDITRTLKLSKQRALVVARQETARLDTAAKSIYYNDPAVNKAYDKIWRALPDARPSHAYMNGQVADKGGWFTTQSGSKVQGPPIGFNDRCRVELVKKKK